jgi:aryl-alcohol dehydrogenase-like predicted oxidoreductase
MPSSKLLEFRATPTQTSALAERHQRVEYRRTTFDLSVSSIGIGTYLGDSTDADDAAYLKSIARSIESGINLLDTALNYRSQRSERVVGAAIQQAIDHGIAERSELVVCSKAGYIPLNTDPPASREEYRAYVQARFIDPEILHPSEIVGGGHSLAPRFLKYCVATSRQNLGLRTIDVYYLHNPGQQLSSVPISELRTSLREAFAAMEEAVSRGDIGVYGVATWDELRVPPDSPRHLSLEDLVGLAKEVSGEAHHLRAVQLPVNLAMQEAVRVATQPLEGILVPALRAAAELGLTAFASASLMQSQLTSGLPQALRDAFPHCTTDAQRAISFTRLLPGVTAALVGMKRVEHVDENIGVFSGK